MKFLDLFSGIGGFRLGMEMAGHECVGHIEIDKYANISYAAMHKPKEGEFFGTDIRAVEPGDLPEADIYCGGFPCQAFSIAGKRGGFEDTRGTLFFEIARLVKERKPNILFLENVAGLLSHENGSTFETILRTLDELGYWYEWQVCNSKNFGVPQNRERVFIIGHLRGTGGGQVFPVYGAGREIIGKGIDIYRSNGIAHSLDANYKNQHEKDYSRRTMVFQKTHGATTTIHYDETGTLQAARLDKTPCVPVLTPDGSEQYAQEIKHGVMVIDPQGRKDKECKPTENCPTLRAEAHGNNPCVLTPKRTEYGLKDGLRIRRLTPGECFRLQGFPDEYFERARAVNSDSQLYKQAGNSVTVNVIYEIAKRL